jgi:3'-5' exoribonuclease
MKSPYVNELEPNKLITTSFLVHSKEIRQKKSGEFYLSLLLADRTGELDAKMWDNVAEVIDAFDRDDFVRVKGLVQIFHNRPQMTIHKVRLMDDSEIDFGDYFPSSRRDQDEMWRELRGIVAGIANVHLKGLLCAVLDDEEIARRYRRAPAAKHIHHAFLGGLIEHVLSLCGLARMAAQHYSFIDADLLLTGAILHDIGKIYELNYERGFSYSNDGQLLGHIHIGLRMIADKLRDLPQFPPALRSLVEHMVLSHHGKLEFGSPKVPQFPEALMLHYLDDMDSKMESMRALIQSDRQVEGCFTAYNTALERSVLKKDLFLNPPGISSEPLASPPLAPLPLAPLPLPQDALPQEPSAASPPVKDELPQEATPKAPAAAPPAATVRNGAPKSDSAFADKLKQALQPAGASEGK